MRKENKIERPELNKNISVKDFDEFYWLKKELIYFCRANGVSSAGGKLEIAERIKEFLTTGKVSHSKKVDSSKTSRFNWSSEVLSPNTVITDNYKNTRNVRNFFTREIGPHFRLNVIFIKWMKENIGKTLGDAIIEWKRIYKMKQDPNYLSEIAPQFEYNRYMRDFLKDNPRLSRKDAIKYWKLKRAQRGSNEYCKKDLTTFKL